MRRSIMQLSKLRGRSIHELSVRGRQELSKFGERFLKLGSREMSDAQFLREINLEQSDLSAARICNLIQARAGSGFFPSLAAREAIITMMEWRFPEERRLMIERADRAIDGRFDLLGLTDISFGNPIDWRLEPVSGKRTTLDHWSKIDYLSPDVAGDKKITWELNRHAHFVTFGQAYWMTGDEKYAAGFVSQATCLDECEPCGPWHKLGEQS